MDYNTVLRSLRYALRYNDEQMKEVFEIDGFQISTEEISDLLKQEEVEGFQTASEEVLRHFLDGLITQKRGPSDPSKAKPAPVTLNNNMIMKKIRIAYELKEEDMIRVISHDGFDISKGELSALFRKKGHKHYRDCGDQLLRNFLRGLAKA